MGRKWLAHCHGGLVPGWRAIAGAGGTGIADAKLGFIQPPGERAVNATGHPANHKRFWF